MPEYATGPGHRSSRGAAVEAYVDTDALELDCPICHAPAGEFCRHESGNERKMPCPKQIAAAAHQGRIKDATKAQEATE